MIAIVNAMIFTMEEIGIIKKGTVLVDGSVIRDVGENLEIPPQARVIDARGNKLFPGFIEPHCHMGITEEKKGREGDDCNECVNPLTPYLRAVDAINPMDAAFHNAVAAGITSAMVGPGSSNVVGGQFAFVKTHGRCIDDMVRLAPAAMKVAFGENPKMNYGMSDKSPYTRMAIASMLREELLHARNYVTKYPHTPEPGKEENISDEFRYGCYRDVFSGKIPLKVHAHRADDILTAIRIAKEFGLEITLDHCSEGHLIAPQIKDAGFPAVIGPDLASRNKIEVQNMAFKTAGELEKNGVTVAVTTDHPVSLIQSLPLCAALAVKEGLPLESGLKALTISAARICRMDHQVGSIKKDKLADLVLFKGHPFDIFSKVLFTMIDGEIVFRDGEMYL
ncbi:MAG: amidohydrolase [Lachnospiraceae bacterium]|nr:amidohydrolase [Lachnospiraceae bacterium]